MRIQLLKKNKMAGGLRLWVLGFMLLSGIGAFAQSTIEVKGRVTSLDTNESLPGASVVQKGTTNGTVTDGDGNYKLAVPADAVLIFSFIGYMEEEIAVGNRTTVDMVLSPDLTTLTEVVVVGYGTVKKSDVTGAVSSLKPSDFVPGAVVNVEQALQGRIAGVQVTSNSGEPGSGMNVKIRGVSSILASNDPLYVIDGMPVNNNAPVGSSGVPNISLNNNVRNPLNGLNPSDIESIEVLKDASATAIYGSRGSNGVVLITTKKGSTGGMKIDYNVQYGVQKVANKLDMLTGEQYRDALNGIIDGGGGVASERVANDVVNTDWQSELFRTAMFNSHDLSISGGKENTKYYTSLGYFSQDGTMKNSGTERYTLRMNLENAVAKKYAIGFNLNTSYIHDDFSSIGLGVNENGSALYSAIYYDPTVPVYTADGSYNRSAVLGTTVDNPVAMVNGQYSNANSFRTFGSVYGEYFLVPELSVKVRVTGDINTSKRNSWVDPSTVVGKSFSGLGQINNGTVTHYMGEATLNYNKELNENHAVNAVVGATYEKFGSESSSVQGRGYVVPDLTFDAIGSGNASLNAIGSNRQSAILASLLGRVNYTFKNRYLLTVSMRMDGSSRFGDNNKFGYFPSMAAAWKIQEEDFMQDMTFIDELKLRASYGTVGNQSIGNYMYMANYNAVSNGPVFNGIRNTLFEPSRLSNPDLKWESSTQADVGVDFSFFGRRLSGSIEYYLRNTSDLLLVMPKPTSTGFTGRTENVGKMRNSGIELALSGDVIRGDKFTWNVGGNFSTIKNRVTDLGGISEIYINGTGSVGGTAGIIRTGLPISSYYGYRIVGVWQQGDDFTGYPAAVKPGDLKFEEQDNVKGVNANDAVVLAKSIPDFNYGINTTFTYQNLSLAVFLEGSKGASVLNSVAVDSYYPVSFRRNRLAEPILNRWTPENPTNEYPSFLNPTSQGQQQVNSKTVEDASYLRLQSARLNYNINLGHGAIKRIQVFVTGQNLFTITNYSGIDPAVNSVASSAGNALRIDYSAYPLARTFSIGANFQL
jgi:TonB-linked SusC/RagA family outer membrane protein